MAENLGKWPSNRGLGEFQREVHRFQAKRSLTSLPSSLKRAWIGVM